MSIVGWDNVTDGSEIRMNKMTIPYLTGDEIEALDKTKYGIVRCRLDGGSGKLANHNYMVSADQQTWIDLTTVAAHTHSSSTEGGLLIDMVRTTPKFVDTGASLFFLDSLDVAKWLTAVSGTGSIANDTDGTTAEKSIKFATGATSGSLSELKHPWTGGLNKVDFTKRSLLECKLRIGNVLNIALKAGINCETVTNVDDNTVKYEAQICTVTNANWNIRSAHGTDKSEIDTGIAITANRVALRLEHFPDIATPKVDLYVDAANAFSKTSHIPTTGNSELNATPKFSFKNSTTADRTLYYYGCRLAYTIDDTWN
jgi:hypothetical protein